MKIVFITLCFAFTAFAQEQQEEYKNFTIGQRFGTFALNIIPGFGFGSAIIMQDRVGTGIHLGLFGTGAVILIKGLNYTPERRDNSLDMDLTGAAFFILGLYFWSTDIIFNIVRSATYDNPKYIQQLSEKPGYKNFTVGQRFGTFALNIIPGLGSVVVMNDWAGAITQWVLVGSGIAFKDAFEGSLGPALICISIAFNIYRSFTYNKPENMAFSKNDGFHLSVLPNRHGKVMPYLLFSKEF